MRIGVGLGCVAMFALAACGGDGGSGGGSGGGATTTGADANPLLGIWTQEPSDQCPVDNFTFMPPLMLSHSATGTTREKVTYVVSGNDVTVTGETSGDQRYTVSGKTMTAVQYPGCTYMSAAG